MYNNSNIVKMDIKQYLLSKGVDIIKEANGQLAIHCLFGDCDHDSKGGEAHLYINVEKGVYFCHKCGAKGNKVTLAKHFGDWERFSWLETAPKHDNYNVNHSEDESSSNKKKESQLMDCDISKVAHKCHLQLSSEGEEYLKTRGLTLGSIKYAEIGEMCINGKRWLTIPITKSRQETSFMKLRCWPGEENNEPKYKNYPGGNNADLYGGWELLQGEYEEVLITEGEFDRLIAKQNGLPFPVSGTAGAGVFKESWLDYLEKVKTVYISLDNDEQGKNGTQKIIELLSVHRPDITIFRITYPSGIKDMTEFFLNGFDAKYLLGECSEYINGPEPIRPSEFKEMSIDELADVLDTTIKYDDKNKCIVFLAMLTAYTDSDQLTVYLNGPSASGKTHLMQENAAYFPEEDIEYIGQASPTAFKHRKPTVDLKTGKQYVNLERKLLLFQDTPDYKLMETLRPLLSHDKKEIVYLTTDRGKSLEFSSKESIIRGFPVCVICSANSKMDEQEATRAIVLSPEISEKKIQASKKMANERTANPKKFNAELEQDGRRQSLKRRVRYIKQLGIHSAIIEDTDATLSEFNKMSGKDQAKHQRSIVHFNSLVKAVAMLNAPFRLNSEGDVVANKNDIMVAAKLWNSFSDAAAKGVSPFVLNFYNTYILPTYKKKGEAKAGITRTDILTEYQNLNGEIFDEYKLRKEIIPELITAKIIKEVKVKNGGNQKYIIPLDLAKQPSLSKAA